MKENENSILGVWFSFFFFKNWFI